MFSPLTEPHTAKLCFSVIFENFLEKSQRTSLFNQKSDYLRKVLWNTQKVFFLNMFEKGKILRNISICLNNFLEQTSKRGQILTKTVFLHKVSHIQLNYFFVILLHFSGNSKRTSLFSQKSDILRNEHWNTQRVCFS